MEAPEWIPLEVDYVKQSKSLQMDLAHVSVHPLLPQKAKKVTSSLISPKSSGNSNLLDPLGVLSDPLGALSLNNNTEEDVNVEEFYDPLQGVRTQEAIEADASITEIAARKAEEGRRANLQSERQVALDSWINDINTSWDIKKRQIFGEYSVQGSIIMNKDAYDPFEGTGIEDGTETRHLDKYDQRLAQLERRQLNENKVEITQAQFEAHVKKLSNDLDTAWSRDERINSLRIAQQLARLLSDTSYPQFYPVMFVLVTDVLEKFGRMVFERLVKKSEEGLNIDNPNPKKRIRLPENFTLDDVPLVAKETCRNWFYKTACIKDLLPRIYVEATLLRSYRFLTDGDYPAILQRLSSICRGLGDPLVGLYARTYLVVKGKEVAPNLDAHSKSMVKDLMFSYKVLRDTHHQIELVRCGIDEARYVRLMSPGFEWMLKTMASKATKEDFQNILHQYREHCNDAMVLGHIITAFDGAFFTEGTGALGMVQLINGAIESSVSNIDTFAEFGKQLAIHPPSEELRMPILNEVWKQVSKSDKIESYIRCAAAWMDVVLKHYGESEVFVLLADITQKLEVATALGSEGTQTTTMTANSPTTRKGEDVNEVGSLSEGVLKHLASILSSLISQSSSVGAQVLTSKHLLQILDVFKGRRKVEMCMDVLESFNRTNSATGDAVLINTLFDIGRNLHDSLDYMSPEGDRRHIARVLNNFIQKVDFGRDLEQQLNVYVECRAIFCNLDMVKDQLVMCVSELAIKAYRLMKGKHNKKTAAFAKACMAYCHITIPSITNVERKLYLLVHCSHIALVNQCLPQTDTFLKAAITLIPEMNSYSISTTEQGQSGGVQKAETSLASLIRTLLSTLVMVPGHPDHGPFYIVSGLLNALPKYEWHHPHIRTSLYIDILGLLCTYAQKKFPYHLPHLESNDMLYCGAPGYAFELAQSIKVCVQEIIKQLQEITSKAVQAKAILEFVNQIVARMKIENDQAVFIGKLLTLASKSKKEFGKGESAYWKNTLEFVSEVTDEDALQNVVKELQSL